MKLFKYPILVFDNIIKQLDPIPLVSLSFCSKKTKERIKWVSFAIERAWFGNKSIKQRGYYFAVKFPSQQILYVIFESYSSNFKKYLKNFSVRIGDLFYDLRHSEKRNSIYMGCIGYKKASLFFNYILGLVRAGINEIEIDLNRLNNTKLFLSEPCFKNVQKIRLDGKAVSSKQVDKFYDCFEKPVLQTCVTSYIRSLSRTSKLLQSENLFMYKVTYISIGHLLNFSGKYISVRLSSLLEEHIISFVKHWLDGNYPNLKGAYISCRMESTFEPSKVLDEFNTKRWNPAERAQNFIFKGLFGGGEQSEFSLKDCSNGMIWNEEMAYWQQCNSKNMINALVSLNDASSSTNLLLSFR
ncbi:unnamed protein product [Caenorhabditis brenneri]